MTRGQPDVHSSASLTGECDELAVAARVERAADEYRFQTADGVCSKRSLRTAELLLAEALCEENVDELLVPEANYGVAGVLLGACCDRVTMTESSARAVRLCRSNAARNDVGANVSLSTGIAALAGSTGEQAGSKVGPTDKGTVDAVAFAPKPYAPIDVTAQRLLDTASRMSSGGRLYLAASDQAGLTRFEGVLDEVSEGLTAVAERGDHRVLEARIDTRAARKATAYVEPRAIDATLDGVELSLVSVPGVFSAHELDDGTRLLAGTATVEDGDRVLDLCCGYGALGTYAAAVADCEVVLSDDDRVATACAERSLVETGVQGTVLTADGVNGVGSERFDRILCNPPTHATDSVLRDLFDGVRGVLAADGELIVVHHECLDLRPHLRAFDRVDCAASGAEHVVLRVTGPQDGPGAV